MYINDDNITNFSNPNHIYEAKASPDGKYLLVWHMDYSPRKISVYDIETKTRLSTFAPGAGGAVDWADYNLIFHEYGAGTNTAFWEFYSVKGVRQWEGGATGAELDASGKFILVYPTLSVTGEEILVADVRDGRVFARVRPPGIWCFETHRWLDGNTVRAWYSTEEGTKSVDMTLNFEKPEPWDSVHHEDSF